MLNLRTSSYGINTWALRINCCLIKLLIAINTYSQGIIKNLGITSYPRISMSQRISLNTEGFLLSASAPEGGSQRMLTGVNYLCFHCVYN